MKKLSITLASLLLVAGLVAASPQRGGKSCASNGGGKETTLIGFISDSSCGLKHMDGMSDERACAIMCVEGGGKFILADRARRMIYQLDQAGQEKAREFAGRQVKVTGRLTGKTVRVTSIEAAS